jgi:hypothetical protein
LRPIRSPALMKCLFRVEHQEEQHEMSADIVSSHC